MKTNRWFAVLVALVLVPTSLLWGAFLLLPVALLLVPLVLLAAVAALPALLVAATSERQDAAHPQTPVPTTPIYST
jgi:O-antigen ligase